MAKLLGKDIWARRKKLDTWIGGCAIPRRTRSAQRHHEEKQWRKDQETPYYRRPTADIEEDYETDCRHGCNGDCVTSGSDRCTAACH